MIEGFDKNLVKDNNNGDCKKEIYDKDYKSFLDSETFREFRLRIYSPLYKEYGNENYDSNTRASKNLEKFENSKERGRNCYSDGKERKRLEGFIKRERENKYFDKRLKTLYEMQKFIRENYGFMVTPEELKEEIVPKMIPKQKEEKRKQEEYTFTTIHPKIIMKAEGLVDAMKYLQYENENSVDEKNKKKHGIIIGSDSYFLVSDILKQQELKDSAEEFSKKEIAHLEAKNPERAFSIYKKEGMMEEMANCLFKDTEKKVLKWLDEIPKYMINITEKDIKQVEANIKNIEQKCKKEEIPNEIIKRKLEGVNDHLSLFKHSRNREILEKEEEDKLLNSLLVKDIENEISRSIKIENENMEKSLSKLWSRKDEYISEITKEDIKQLESRVDNAEEMYKKKKGYEGELRYKSHHRFYIMKVILDTIKDIKEREKGGEDL